MATEVRGPAAYFPSIEKKYGRSIAEWRELMAATGINKHVELVAWLKHEHGMGHGHANALTADVLSDAGGADRLVGDGLPAPSDPDRT